MTKKAHRLLSLEVFVGCLLIVFFLLIFLKLSGDVLEKELLPIDLQILRLFYTIRSPLLNTVMILITNLGGEIMVGFGIIIACYLSIKRYLKEAFLFSLIVGGAGIINSLLKNIFQRVRPQFYPLVIEKDYSFPSGHAMDSFVFYIVLSYLFLHMTKNKKLSIIVAIFSLLLILLIGISRIYLGVHYPTDVLGGYIAGFIWLLIIILIRKIKYLLQQ